MRLRPLSLLPLVLLGSAAFSCAVAFSPGDYPASGSPDSGFAPDGAPLQPGDGGTGTASRLLLVTGERDGTDPLGNEVWSAPIDGAGELGEFTNEKPTLYRGTIAAANVSDGRLFVSVLGSGTARNVQFISLDKGLVGNWQGMPVPVPQYGAYAQVFAGPNLVSLGGGSMTDAEGETPSPIFDDRIQVYRFAPDKNPPRFDGPHNLEDGGQRLPVPARDMLAVTYKDFVYIVGGASELPADAGQSTAVYVARRDPVSGVGAFTRTESVTANGAPHAPVAPILCTTPGYLVMLGGDNTDIVVTAKINEETGALEPWKTTTKLLGELRAAACTFFAGKLHLFGGIGASSRVDRILRAVVNPDGTLGAWEPSARVLPAPRSSLFATTY